MGALDALGHVRGRSSDPRQSSCATHATAAHTSEKGIHCNASRAALRQQPAPWSISLIRRRSTCSSLANQR